MPTVIDIGTFVIHSPQSVSAPAPCLYKTTIRLTGVFVPAMMARPEPFWGKLVTNVPILIMVGMVSTILNVRLSLITTRYLQSYLR